MDFHTNFALSQECLETSRITTPNSGDMSVL